MLRRPALASAAAAAVLVITGALAVAPAASGPRPARAGAAGSPAGGTPAATLASAAAPGAAFPSSAAGKVFKETLAAWKISRGQGVTVAVLSDGVDPVSGLAGKLTQGPDYAPLPGASAKDGTLLASAIAGSGPTSAQPFGNIGIAPGARVLAERIADYDNPGNPAAAKYQADRTWQSIMARAIRYAVNHGAGVIVMDETSYRDKPVLASAVAYAVSRNVILIGDAGVVGKTPWKLAYPDSLPGVINFTAQPLQPLPESDGTSLAPDNDSVLLSAPGDEMSVTGPGSESFTVWDFYTAAGWVAGTAAIIKSVYPHITDAEVERALAESATYQPAGGYSTKVGFGLINPQGALTDAAKLVKQPATAPPGAASLSASARFGSRPVAVIDAVRHAPRVLETDGGAIAAGLVLLVIALVIGRRRRRPVVAAGPPGLAPAGLAPAGPSGYPPPPGPAFPVPGPHGYAPPAPAGTGWPPAAGPPPGQFGYPQPPGQAGYAPPPGQFGYAPPPPEAPAGPAPGAAWPPAPGSPPAS